MKILIVEDDELNAFVLTSVLTNQNYVVEVAVDGDAAWDLIETYDYDLILLDVMLPKLDGISLCRKIRSQGQKVPILLLTGCDSGHEKAIGLDAGADDYVVKPFDQEELVARVRALLRRGSVTTQPILEWGNLRLDPSSCEVVYEKNLLALTPKEYALLELFLRNNRRVFSCSMILEHLWSYEDMPGEEAVRTHIKGLRQKLKTVGASTDLIETVYGIGYRLKPLSDEQGNKKELETQKSPISHTKSTQQSLKDVVTKQTIEGIAKIWEQYRGRVDEQIRVLEQAAENFTQKTNLNSELRLQAVQEAHTLAGALGTFGFTFASELARKIEKLLKSSQSLNATEANSLQNWVKLLHQEIDDNPQKVVFSLSNQPTANILSDYPIVLVVDDDLQILALLETLLSPWGFKVITLNDSRKFWKTLTDVKPDMVVLDVEMPDINGMELCQLVRNDSEWSELPILFLTVHNDVEIVNKLFSIGADDFVSKPIIGSELITRIMNRWERVKLLRRMVQTPKKSIETWDKTNIHKPENELELRVAERTSELIATNQKLLSELTELQQIQEELQISQHRFEGILNIADDAIISIDSNQFITLFNQGAENLFGYSAQEIIGESLDILLPGRFINIHRQHIMDFGKSSSHARRMGERRELFARRQDGTEFPAEASISKLSINNEYIYTVILRDITERKQIERMKDEFVSVVSHELRTPLTSIHGSLGMLTSGLLSTDSEQGKRLLQIATDSTDRLVRLINDILDIERIESGKVKMEKEYCNVIDLIASAINVMQSLADQAGVTLSVSSLSLYIWVDPDRIIQTLTNLLSNAIKFSPPGATVCLTVEQKHTQVLFTVKDTGRGIPSDKIDTIFERFQQVDSSDSRNHEGTGLGLAICKSIIQQHSGQIWVESFVGKGSTFYFTLPLLTDSPSTEVIHQNPIFFVTEDFPLVLVCDDDEMIRNDLQHLLEQEKYRVITVASGEEAITKAISLHPDVILLDLLMPGMNGWETMAILKERSDTKNIPILICSVYTPNQNNLPNPDFVDWLSKPLEESHLLKSLQKVMTESSQRVRILIVEDDHDLADLLITLFERNDMETFLAKTGKEAIHLSQEINPDILILDLILPETDGFAVVDWLKQHNQLCNIPLVVYSAKDVNELERRRLKLGNTEFLTKGRVTIQEFEQRVIDLLEESLESQKERGSHDYKTNFSS